MPLEHSPHRGAESKRDSATEAILAYVLESGLEDIGLRKLAKVSGVSDRMLIYYFGTKENLLKVVFETLESRVISGLAMAIGPKQRDPEQLISDLDQHLQNPQLRNVMMLLLEGMARALRDIEPYKSTIMRVRTDLNELVESRLLDPSATEWVLTVVEGRNMLRLMQLA